MGLAKLKHDSLKEIMQVWSRTQVITEILTSNHSYVSIPSKKQAVFLEDEVQELRRERESAFLPESST